MHTTLKISFVLIVIADVQNELIFQKHTRLKRNRGKENVRTFSGQAPFASDKLMYNVNKRSPEWNLTM